MFSKYVNIYLIKLYSNNNQSRSVQSKSVYDKSIGNQKLPQIVELGPRKYKSKLLKVESRTNTGLNLNNKESKIICCWQFRKWNIAKAEDQNSRKLR